MPHDSLLINLDSSPKKRSVSGGTLEKRIFVSSPMKYIERHSCDGGGGANVFLSGFM